MSSSNSTNRGGNKRKEVKLVEKLRNACPPHRINDIEALVKQYKGDENKISHAIQEWWEEEPESKEAEWQDVNKKAVKKTGNQNYNRQNQNSGGNRGDRDRGGRDNYRSSGSGRGFYGRGMGGGRGAGAERRNRDYGRERGSGRDRDRESRNGGNRSYHSSDAVIGTLVETKGDNNHSTNKSTGVPTPVTNVSPPKGAWGQNANSYAGAATPAQDKVEIVPVPDVLADVGSVTAHDPTPAGFLDSKAIKPLEPILSPADDGFGPISSTRSSVPVPAPPAGNVWATKGSAHLIKQEAVKQKPPAPRHLEPVDVKARKSNENNRNNQRNKPHQLQSHDEQDIIAETTTLSVPVNSDPVVSRDASEVTSPNEVHTTLPPSMSNPADALDAALESLLPASVNGANVNAAGWSPRQEPDTPPAEISPIISFKPSTTEEVYEEIKMPDADLPIPTAEVDPPSAPPVPQMPASTVLLGAWDVTGADDTGLDFGFGSFGNENDAASEEEKDIVNPPTNQLPTHTTDIAAPVSSKATTVSPARPPPGLSIGGMPPMPANAVPVHELEGKLESVSLGVSASKHTEDSSKNVDGTSGAAPLASNTSVGPNLADNSNASKDLSDTAQTSKPQPPNLISTAHLDSANQMLANQSYGAAYGMGIYNYNGANVGNGFMGIHGPNAQVLGGVLPQQPQQQKPPQQATSTNQQQGNSQAGIPQHLPQGQQPQSGIYGAPSSNANVGVTSTEGPTSGSNDTPSSTGIPPGMPGAMPYNPAIFYGQQYYQMGQPHGGVGYGHGYGQFGAGVQSGFGYQQVMQQNGGYGQPYDDTPQQHHGSHTTHHNSNNHQNYQKNNHGGSGSGGYRGRNNHHGNSHHGSHNSGGHQYQNQYNPQHGGYGAQPYNMGYGVDQFGNRNGYVTGNMDPYAMQQNGAGYQSGASHSTGGFNQDDPDHQLHGKGKPKGGTTRGNNNSFNSGNPNMQQFQQIPPQQQGGQSQQQQGFGFQGGVSETSNAGGGTGSSNNGWSNQGWTGSTWQGSN